MCVWLIFLTADTWDLMASCSKSEYKSADRPEKCEYQDAECQYDDGQRVFCKVRRKGSASWRDMDSRPSLKIKDMELNGSKYPFDERPESDKRRWVSERVTLNNGVQKHIPEAEVKSYDIFRDLGVAAPLAKLCSVKLYRGGVLFSTEHDYTMIETISDKAFMEKHFGFDWMLWEVELGETECKKDDGIWDDACKTDKSNMEKLTLGDVNEEEMINYFVGERLSSHTDSACLGFARGNNYYVSKWLKDGNVTYTYIPSGVDQTFICWYQYATFYPQCGPMQQCFESDECHEKYVKRYDDAKVNVYNPVWPCISTWHKVSIGVVGGINVIGGFLASII